MRKYILGAATALAVYGPVCAFAQEAPAIVSQSVKETKSAAPTVVSKPSPDKLAALPGKGDRGSIGVASSPKTETIGKTGETAGNVALAYAADDRGTAAFSKLLKQNAPADESEAPEETAAEGEADVQADATRAATREKDVPEAKEPAEAAAEEPEKDKAADEKLQIDVTNVRPSRRPKLIATARNAEESSQGAQEKTEEKAAEASAKTEQPKKPERSSYSTLISKYANIYGVPFGLAHAVVRIESNFHANARGSAGEIGLMQIKLATARMMGYSGTAKALYHPETNIKYGMMYLAKAHQLGGGSTCGTILKYNAGHGAKKMNPISSRYCQKVKKHLKNA